MAHRYFVTGTDTDVGKTVIAAGLACALKSAGEDPLFVKAVQTGVAHGDAGDAERAGRLADCRFAELARFRKPADPWSAALAEGCAPLRARELAAEIARLPGALVVEGSGGIAVPLNAEETLGQVALLADLEVVLVVGLRLGCINHALLSLAYCGQLGLRVAGLVLAERWEPKTADYRDDVERALCGQASVFGCLSHESDERIVVERAVGIFGRQGI